MFQQIVRILLKKHSPTTTSHCCNDVFNNVLEDETDKLTGLDGFIRSHQLAKNA